MKSLPYFRLNHFRYIHIPLKEPFKLQRLTHSQLIISVLDHVLFTPFPSSPLSLLEFHEALCFLQIAQSYPFRSALPPGSLLHTFLLCIFYFPFHFHLMCPNHFKSLGSTQFRPHTHTHTTEGTHNWGYTQLRGHTTEGTHNWGYTQLRGHNTEGTHNSDIHPIHNSSNRK